MNATALRNDIRRAGETFQRLIVAGDKIKCVKPSYQYGRRGRYVGKVGETYEVYEVNDLQTEIKLCQHGYWVPVGRFEWLA